MNLKLGYCHLLSCNKESTAVPIAIGKRKIQRLQSFQLGAVTSK